MAGVDGATRAHQAPPISGAPLPIPALFAMTRRRRLLSMETSKVAREHTERGHCHASYSQHCVPSELVLAQFDAIAIY